MTALAVPDPIDAERRLRAKRQNERLKLLVSFLNTLGLAVLGAAFVVPGINSLASIQWSWVLAGIALHLTAQGVLQRLRSEE